MCYALGTHWCCWGLDLWRLCFDFDGSGNKTFVDIFGNETTVQLIQSTLGFNIQIKLENSFVFVDVADLIVQHQDTFALQAALSLIEQLDINLII
jgi:hypothetical protein